MTLTQAEVELGDPVEEVQEPGPQPEVEGREGELHRPPKRQPCGANCQRRCTDHISEERWREIWSQYWGMTYKVKTEGHGCFTRLPKEQKPARKVTVAAHSSTG